MERDKREQVIKALEEVIAEAVYPDRPRKFMMSLELAEDALALLKAREPDEDWISRKRLRNEIQYYIEEAGWGDEVNKVLGWCLEFIDNQEAVKWE